MILILSKFADEHARAVTTEIEAMGAEVTLLDLSNFPHSSFLSLRFQETYKAFHLEMTNGTLIDFTKCRAVWWRRPQPLQLSDTVTNDRHRLFAYSEAQEAIAGLWETLDANWINHPGKDLRGHRKVYQLRLAQDIGLRIPNTLITSSPKEARAFLDSRSDSKTICKSFSATEDDWRETRIVTDEELTQLDSVALAPVIFQEYIEAAYDLRITVVGKRLFAAAIYSQETSYKIDFRMDIANAGIEPVELPVEIEDLLLEYMRRLELTYGAIDMRVTPEGEYVFLEINPAGQWLFIEQETKQPIARALAEELVRLDWVDEDQESTSPPDL